MLSSLRENLDKKWRVYFSSSLPYTDIVGAFANLVGSLRLPVRDSFQSTVTRSLALFPYGQTSLIVLNLLAGLVEMRKISLGSESPRRSTSRGGLVSWELETD